MDLSIGGFALIPIMVGLLQVIKMTGFPKKFIPALGVVIGAVGMGFLAGFSAVTVIAGIVIGLSAKGLYDFPEAVKKM